MRTVKKIFPFIIVLAVLCSALSIISYASTTYVGYYANYVYRENSTTDQLYNINNTQISLTLASNSAIVITDSSINYTCYRYNTGFTDANKTRIIINTKDHNKAFLINKVVQIGSTGVYLLANVRSNNMLALGFNNYTTVVDQSLYSSGSLDYVLCNIYNEAKQNGNKVDTSYFTIIRNNITEIDTSSIVVGNVGDVYQGIVKLPNNVFFNTVTTYNYNIQSNNITIDWYIQSEISGINYVSNGLYLVYGTESMEISIPQTENTLESYYYDFGILSAINTSSSDSKIHYSLNLNGTTYMSDADPLHALVTELILQAFDVREFMDHAFVWCTPATVEQDLIVTVIDNQLFIINRLGHIINFLEEDTTVDLSEPGFDDMFEMIDTQDIFDAKAMLDEVDLSSHLSGVNFIINTASYAFINPVISTVLLSILFAFSVAIMVIKGLRR